MAAVRTGVEGICGRLDAIRAAVDGLVVSDLVATHTAAIAVIVADVLAAAAEMEASADRAWGLRDESAEGDH